MLAGRRTPVQTDDGPEPEVKTSRSGPSAGSGVGHTPRLRAPRIWLSSACSWPRRPASGVPSSSPATAHSRLPRRLPAPGTAVMSSLTWFSWTRRPRMLRSSGPSTRLRMLHAAALAATRPVSGLPLIFLIGMFWTPENVVLGPASLMTPFRKPLTYMTPSRWMTLIGVNEPATASPADVLPVTLLVIWPRSDLPTTDLLDVTAAEEPATVNVVRPTVIARATTAPATSRRATCVNWFMFPSEVTPPAGQRLLPARSTLGTRARTGHTPRGRTPVRTPS